MPLKTTNRTATVIYTKDQPVEIFNAPIILGSSSMSSITGLTYFKIPTTMTINKVELQIFEKGAATSGILELDVLKTSDLSIAASSIMTSKPSLDMTTAIDYQTSLGVINPAVSFVLEGDYIRLDLTQIPTSLGKLQIRVYGIT